MPTGTGIGIDFSQLDAAFKSLDAQLRKLTTEGENFGKTMRDAFKSMSGAEFQKFLNGLTDLRKQIVGSSKDGIFGFGKQKMLMNWDSAGLQKYIDDINRLIYVIKAVQAEGKGAGLSTKGLQITGLKNEVKEAEELLRIIKRVEKEAAAATKASNQTYAGAMAYSRSTQTIEQEAYAIANLEAAKKKLVQTDANYKSQLNDLNEEIQRHKKNIADANKTDRQRAEEAAKNADKIAKAREREQRAAEAARKKAEEAQARYDSKSRRERYQSYVTSYEGAIRTSDKARTLLQEQQAIKNLEAARARLSKTDKDYEAKLNTLNKRILEHKNNIDKATAGSNNLQKSHRSLMDISGQLARKLALVFSVSQIQGYVNKMIQVRGEFELQQRSLQAIIQDKDMANEVWQKTVDLAVRSPFRVGELVKYTKQLAAYRIESDKLYETNKMLADVSAGLGVDMSRLILAFGQVRSAAYLRGTELRQFTEAGIPMLEELSKYFTELEGHAISTGDVFERISKRMVAFADVEEVFRRITSEGGIFYNMQEIQAETLKGQISNLKDSIDIMLNEMGLAFDATLKNGVRIVKNLVDNWQDLAYAIKLTLIPLGTYLTITGAIKFANTAFSQGLLMMGMNFKTTSKWLIDAEKNLVKFASKLGLGKNVAAGFVKVLGGLASLGVAGIIAGIVVGLGVFITKMTSASRAAKRLQKDLAAIFNEDTTNLKTQIRAFESLVGRLNDVNEGSVEHKEIISQLNSQYGEYLGFIVDERTTYEQLAQSIDSVTLALTRKAKMASFEKAYSKTLEETNKQIQTLEDRITKQAFKEGMTTKDDDGKIIPLVPTQDEIDDIFGLIEKKVRETGKTITSYEQLNEIVSKYYGKDVEVAGTAIKNFTDITDYYLQQKEAELELDRKINDVYGDSLRSSAEARQAFADLEERQAKALKDAEKESKWVKEDIRNQFAKEKIDLEVKYEGLDEATAELRKKTLDSMSATIKDVNEKIEGSVVDLGEKYANLIYIDTNEASKSINEIAESTAASYEAQKDIIKQQNALKDAGTAYDAEMLENAELSAKAYYYKLQLLGRLDLLQKEEKKEEKASVKILQRRINLLKEVNRKYLELAKTFDSQTAEKKIIEAYSDTFKEAFEGTGVDLDLYKVMTQSVIDAKKIGGEAGSTLTEAMLEKLQALENAGTYIRSFSNDLVEEIKKSEGFRARAYQDAGGVWTQGYGETQGIEKGKVWTEEFAAQRLQTRLTEDYASAVNKVLDANRDLIITQEQYNALVDLAYNGGGGAVKTLVNYAKDVEQGASYIERISKKIEATMGEEAAARFGETFVNSFKEAESVQERMAMLLQTMNLTIKGKIDKDWYEGMQRRSDKRAAMFSGDLDIANQLETVLVRIAGMDFKTTEGMVEALNQLKAIAEKEGPEAQKILSQVISGFEAEIGLRIKKEADEKLKDDIQELFDRYDLSLELKKLNIPPDLAKSLFDVEYLDLKGLKKAVQDQEAKFVGTDMEDEYKKFLEKIDDMEDKAAKERMKTYVKYLQEGMSERVKLKIEELRKLKEIEESDEFTPAQKARIKANVSKEARAEQQAQDWKDFQGSEMYTMMFEDIEFLGTKALENLKKKLEELKGSLKDLPASEVKEIVNQISKIEDITIQRNPFTSLRDAMKEVRALQKEGKTEASLQEAFAEAELKRQSYQEELDAVNLVLNATALEKKELMENVAWREKYGHLLTMDTDTLEDQALLLGVQASNQEHIASLAGKDLEAYADARKAMKAVVEQWETFRALAQSAWDSAKTIMESLGVESDSLAMTIGDAAMNMVDLIFQAVQFHLQLQLMTAQAKILEVEMNAALGPIGWVVLALEAIATLLSAILGARDKALQKTVEDNLATVERLQKTYEDLEDAIDNAWDVASIQAYNQELRSTTEEMIRAQKAAIAAQEQRKGANREGSDAYNELQEMKAELDELEAQLDESLANSFSKVTDGILDSVQDAARDFTDAWWDAFVETGDGLKGLEENFNEMFLNLAKNQAAMQITGAFADRWKKDLEEYINEDDTELTKDEAKAWAEKVRKTFPELSAALEAYLGAFKGFADSEAGGLSALQKGIQGVTEETAQVIEALLNSMRMYVADSNNELKEHTRYLRDLYRLFNGMTSGQVNGLNVRIIP